MRRQTHFTTLLVVVTLSTALTDRPRPGRNTAIIRGQAQDIYYYRATGAADLPHSKVLFAPGDGGFRGFAITIAETVASGGYDVYGVDTKVYLESFTGKTSLTEKDVMSDFRQMADWIRQGDDQPVTLLGWSEGAGLAVLAAAPEHNKDVFNGVITLGLSETALLGWRWSDFTSWFTKKDPKEASFSTSEYLPRIAPLPFVMIQSSQDEYVPLELARRLFAVAVEPKRFSLIEARNHRFDGNQDELFRTLREGLQWIHESAR